MSWLFSQALGEEFLEANSLDGEPFAQLNVMPTARPFWRNDKTIDSSHLSRFGLTQRLLTDDRGEELLTWFRAAFLARTFPRQATGPALMEKNPAYGKKGRASFAKFDRRSLSWRTRQISLLGDCIEFSETWPKWGLMQSGAAYRLRTPSGLKELRQLITCAKESGSSVTAPTPTVHGNNNRKGASPTSGDGLATFALRVPTPRHQDGKHAGVTATETVIRRANAGQANLAEFVLTVPTPTKTDSTKWNNKTEQQRRDQGSSVRIGNVVTDEAGNPVGGTLNPNWVEWLMGWPIGWTALEPLAMDKFRAWQHSHGDF